MSRTRARARKVAAAGSKSSKAVPKAAGPSSAPSIDDLVDKAHTLLAQSDFPLAIKFLTRALSLDPRHLEARELLGVAELEGGDPDAGRANLLQLFPPHKFDPPSEPSPYLYLAQTAEDPNEALGYYSTATAMLEKSIVARKSKGKGRKMAPEEDEEERKMAVTALVAMIEIWMSDLCFEKAAPSNCDALIARALTILPDDPEVKLSLASIRMSQSRLDEAKAVVVGLYEEIQGKEPFDDTLPALPARLDLTRLLLEFSLHLPALDVLSTIREEDSLQVEGAYLEGWALCLRAEALETNPSQSRDANEEEAEMIPQECYEEAMRALLECARLFAEQDYPDEGIGAHVKELLEGLERKGVKPAEGEEGEGEDGEENGMGNAAGDGEEWEDLDAGDVDVDGDGDVDVDGDGDVDVDGDGDVDVDGDGDVGMV